jgi:hypothetical protein
MCRVILPPFRCFILNRKFEIRTRKSSYNKANHKNFGENLSLIRKRKMIARKEYREPKTNSW